jgi:hypothetical protein
VQSQPWSGLRGSQIKLTDNDSIIPGYSAVASGLIRDAVLGGNSVGCLYRFEPAAVVVAISVSLERVAHDVLGAVQTKPEQIDAATLWVIAYYKHISVHEIGLAFDLALAGKLGDVDVNAYYGQFSMALLSRVLLTYSEYRSVAVTLIQRGVQSDSDVNVSLLEASTDSLDLARISFLSTCDVAVTRVFTRDYKLLRIHRDWRPESENMVDIYNQAAVELRREIKERMNQRVNAAFGNDDRMMGAKVANTGDEILLRKLSDLDIDFNPKQPCELALGLWRLAAIIAVKHWIQTQQLIHNQNQEL